MKKLFLSLMIVAMVMFHALPSLAAPNVVKNSFNDDKTGFLDITMHVADSLDVCKDLTVIGNFKNPIKGLKIISMQVTLPSAGVGGQIRDGSSTGARMFIASGDSKDNRVPYYGASAYPFVVAGEVPDGTIILIQYVVPSQYVPVVPPNYSQPNVNPNNW
jgi:hypothetical protein